VCDVSLRRKELSTQIKNLREFFNDSDNFITRSCDHNTIKEFEYQLKLMPASKKEQEEIKKRITKQIEDCVTRLNLVNTKLTKIKAFELN
jgi:hypothetical protein